MPFLRTLLGAEELPNTGTQDVTGGEVPPVEKVETPATATEGAADGGGGGGGGNAAQEMMSDVAGKLKEQLEKLPSKYVSVHSSFFGI